MPDAAPGTCFACGGSTFSQPLPQYLRCTACGHETLVAGVGQTLMLNEPLSVDSVRRLSALDRFQGAVLDRFRAGRPNGQLLDVGSGSGRFLYHQRRKFDRACGVEITPEAVSFSREQLGLDVVNRIEEAPDEVDVVTAWHSIEHVPAPALNDLLRGIARKLGRRGCVIVSVPNAASLQYRLFGRRYAFFDVPNHQHQFTPASLEQVFDAHGFRRTGAAVSWPYNAFGYTQGLLNAVVPAHNHLYRRLKRGHGRGTILADSLSVALLPVAAPCGTLLAGLDALLPRRQAVLTWCFERKP